jgi:hypothetical protein
LLAVSTQENKVRLWDLTASTPKELASLQAPKGLNRGVVFSQDGKLFAGAGDDGKARLWNRAGNAFKERGVIDHPKGLETVAISPDGKRLATGGWDAIVRLWDITTGKFTQTATLEGHTGNVVYVQFSPDGKWLLSSGYDKKVILWDVAGARVARKWEFPWKTNFAVMAPDGRHIAVSPGGNIYIIRVGSFSAKPRPSSEKSRDHWVSLFNGKDLTGWKEHPGGGKPAWVVHDGVLEGGRTTLFTTRDDYENFHLRFEGALQDGRGGVAFRARRTGGSIPEGFYMQSAGFGPGDHTGCLFRTGQLGNSLLAGVPAGIEIGKNGEWFTQEVTAIDRRITIRVNGRKTVEYVAPSAWTTKGAFALHLQAGVVQYRKIEVKELPSRKKSEK